MKILLLSQWFEPEPTSKGLAFAKELARRGHSVQVLTGFPNYPGGKVYPGYRIRPWQHETVDGVPVLRVALYASHSRSRVGRALNYLTFAASAAVAGSLLHDRPDAIYAYHPPITVGIAAAIISRLRRIPFLYDIQDMWPDSINASGMGGNQAMLRVLAWCCLAVYRTAQRIAVLSPGFKRLLVARGVPSEKISVIYNWCNEDALSTPVSKTPLRPARPGRLTVMFAGNLGIAQGLDTVLAAAALCQARNLPTSFVFVGDGIDGTRLRSRARDLNLVNVSFVPRQPMEEMPSVLGSADVLLVHLKDEDLFSITIPSKLQAYMACAKPVLMAVRGDAARIVQEAKCGLVCPPADPRKLADAVGEFAAMGPDGRQRMGHAGQRFYNERLSMRAGVDQFESALASMCKP